MKKIDVVEDLIYKIKEIVVKKKQGFSYKEISKLLGIGQTTAVRWNKRVKNGESPEEIAISSVKTNPNLWGLPSVASGAISKEDSIVQDLEIEQRYGTGSIKTSTQNTTQDADDLDKNLDEISETSINQTISNIEDYTSEQLKALIDDDLNLDEDTKKEVKKLINTNQKNKDKLRIERTLFRSNSRFLNAWGEYFDELKDVVSNNTLSPKQQKHQRNYSGVEEKTGVIHFSDLHFNEVIDLKTNKFNFDIASKRIQKHVDNCLKVFNAYDINDVVVCFTGDILNSDRRLDELLMNATNRAKATFMAVDILKAALEDVSETYNVRVASITGNESRINKDVGWVNGIAQDNFDYIISEILKYTFKDNLRVEFLPPDDTFLEKVVDVSGQKLLLIHGHAGNISSNLEQKFASKMGQYASQGIIVDYMISGHIHASIISDMYARSSGLPGSNNYSQNALNLTGRASQNFYIFTSTGDRHGMKVDLQNTDGYEGYDFQAI